MRPATAPNPYPSRNAWLMTLALACLLSPLSALGKETMRTIDWLELMPESERKALEAMSDIEHDGDAPAYSFTSVETVPAMDGAKGRIAAFVVPVAHDDQGRITELFLVPYFGACVHVPPPPPNQIIYVKPTTPIASADFWEPMWAIGTMKVSHTRNDMAEAAYQMELDALKEIDLAEFQGAW